MAESRDASTTLATVGGRRLLAGFCWYRFFMGCLTPLDCNALTISAATSNHSQVLASPCPDQSKLYSQPALVAGCFLGTGEGAPPLPALSGLA